MVFRHCRALPAVALVPATFEVDQLPAPVAVEGTIYYSTVFELIDDKIAENCSPVSINSTVVPIKKNQNSFVINN